MSEQPTRFRYPDLPISRHREEIAAALRRHQVVVVVGETGSGKTTQLPKIALEVAGNRRGKLGCTQPRRLAAVAVATPPERTALLDKNKKHKILSMIERIFYQ